MQIDRTPLPGVIAITPVRHGDVRGFFSESWSHRRLVEHGIDLAFVQDNHSVSETAGTLRGLHFQAPPHAQDKLVRCGRGALWDVAVDIRTGSPTYGQWHAEELTAVNGRQLLVPAGFLHGFVSLVDDTEILYKCTDYYDPEAEGTVAHDDPVLAIDWPLPKGRLTLSARDAGAGPLAAIGSPFTYSGPCPWEAPG